MMRNAPLAPGRAQLGAPHHHTVRSGSGSVQGVPAGQPEWEETSVGPRVACQDRAEAVGRTAPDLCTDISEQASPTTQPHARMLHSMAPPQATKSLSDSTVPPGPLPPSPSVITAQHSVPQLVRPARPPTCSPKSPTPQGAVPKSPAQAEHQPVLLQVAEGIRGRKEA